MQVLILAAFSYWFAAMSGIPIYISGVLFKFGIKKSVGYSKVVGTSDSSTPIYAAIRLYPIDCEKCLAFWLGVIYFWHDDYFLILAGVTSFTAMVIGLLINKLR